jgi:hypothetical protein
VVRYGGRKRDVFIDGRRQGETDVLLIVRDGRHDFSLGEPVDYQPPKQRVTVLGTGPGTPRVLAFT